MTERPRRQPNRAWAFAGPMPLGPEAPLIARAFRENPSGFLAVWCARREHAAGPSHAAALAQGLRKLAGGGFGCPRDANARGSGQPLRGAASGSGPPPLWPWPRSRFSTMCSRAGFAGASLSIAIPLPAPWCGLRKPAKGAGCCISCSPAGVRSMGRVSSCPGIRWPEAWCPNIWWSASRRFCADLSGIWVPRY